VAEDNQDLYERVWGEPPPASGPVGEPAAPIMPVSSPVENEAGVMLEPAVLDAPAPAVHQPVPEPPEGRRSILVQQQMAETLRRLEARVAELQQQVQPFAATNFSESIQAVQELAQRLTKAANELEGLIEYGERMVQELADLQAEARRRLPPGQQPLPDPKRRRFR
jgi:hypothetical protein